MNPSLKSLRRQVVMNILLSIKREYTEKIFSGEKRYEFRKQKPNLSFERIFIYECRPSKNIVGFFSVNRILSGSPREIWKKCKHSSGIEKENYFTYCNGKNRIYAFEIDEVFQFNCPINPLEIIPDFKPPQNFTYLDSSIITENIKRRGGY